MMQTRAVVVRKDENGKRVYELRESVRGISEKYKELLDLELAVGLTGLTVVWQVELFQVEDVQNATWYNLQPTIFTWEMVEKKLYLSFSIESF